MRKTQWVQYRWDLTTLPSEEPPLDARYKLETARSEDADKIKETMNKAYRSESGWLIDLNGRLELVNKLVANDLPDKSMNFLVVRHGNRIVACSVVDPHETSEDHLPVGLCVIDEYQSRGLGSFLLYQSLLLLKEKGITEARTETKRGLNAQRYLYAKFGGKCTRSEPVAIEKTKVKAS